MERMSHEIRTPMNSIIGLTYLTREYVNNEKQVLENLDKISQSARFMLSFVDDILNLSQIESGNVALNSQKVVLDAFWRRRWKRRCGRRRSVAFTLRWTDAEALMLPIALTRRSWSGRFPIFWRMP